MSRLLRAPELVRSEGRFEAQRIAASGAGEMTGRSDDRQLGGPELCYHWQSPIDLSPSYLVQQGALTHTPRPSSTSTQHVSNSIMLVAAAKEYRLGKDHRVQPDARRRQITRCCSGGCRAW